METFNNPLECHGYNFECEPYDPFSLVNDEIDTTNMYSTQNSTQ